jgi:hypothetical protein
MLCTGETVKSCESKISNPVSTTPKVKTKQNSSCYGTLTVTFEGYFRNAAIHSLNLWSKTEHDKFIIRMDINELEIVNYKRITRPDIPILEKYKRRKSITDK